MNARDLRLWHWRAAMSARATANKHEEFAEEWEKLHPGVRCTYDRHRAKNDHRRADFHIHAVQVLNDHPECIYANTTAEQDDKMFPKPHSRKKK